MTHLVSSPVLIFLSSAAGILLGVVHFGSLRWITRLYVGGRPWQAFGLQVFRFAVLLATLAALARFGASSLLAGALGLLAIRRPILRRFGGNL